MRKEDGYSRERLVLDADIQRNDVSLQGRGLNSASIMSQCKLASVLGISPVRMLERADRLRARDA